MNICIVITQKGDYRTLNKAVSYLGILLKKDKDDIINIRIREYKEVPDSLMCDINSYTLYLKETGEYSNYDIIITIADFDSMVNSEKGKECDFLEDFLHIYLKEKMVIVKPPTGEEDDTFLHWFYTLFRVVTIFLLVNEMCDVEDCIRSSAKSMNSGFVSMKNNLCTECQSHFLHQGFSPRMIDRIRRITEKIDEVTQLSIIDSEREDVCPYAEMLWINRKSSLTYLHEKMGFGPMWQEISPQLPYEIWQWFIGDADYWWLRGVSHLIRRSSEVDIFSYLTQKRSRDHCRHQIYVASLGLRLLEIRVNSEESMAQYFLRALKAKYDLQGFDVSSLKEEHVYQTWLLTSLLHDVGYPLAHLISTYVNIHGSITFDGKMILDMLGLCRNLSYHIWGDFLNNISRTSEPDKERLCTAVNRELKGLLMSSFLADNRDLYEPLLRHSIFKGEFEGEQDKERLNRAVFDHGLWSAASIISSLPYEESKSSDISIDNIILWEALQAISLHNEENVETFRDLDIIASPLTFLLILCDNIQEWDRCIVKQGKFVKPEIERINAGPFFLVLGALYYDELLQISFYCPESKRLKESDWLYDKFTESKLTLERILNAWKKPQDFRPSKFRFQLSIKI